MLLQGQDDAVCNNCSQDHVLKWSVRVKEKLKGQVHSFHFISLHFISFHSGIVNVSYRTLEDVAFNQDSGGNEYLLKGSAKRRADIIKKQRLIKLHENTPLNVTFCAPKHTFFSHHALVEGFMERELPIHALMILPDG